jgi:hypothetical protein
MARQALIKLRRGNGAPADGALQEGELAIDISAKKLYSANATGNSFTLSGDQYNLEQSGNASHGIITLTVDNAGLSNDNILVTGGADITVAGNSSVINVNSTSTLDSVLGRGSTSTSTIGVGNTTVSGFINATGSVNVGTTFTVDGVSTFGNTVNIPNSPLNVSGTTNTGGLIVTGTSTFEGNILIGNSTVNVAITEATGSINMDGTLDVGGATSITNTLAAGNTTVTGFANVSGAGTFGGAVNIDDTTGSTSTGSGALIVDGGVGIAENLYVGGDLVIEGSTTQVSSTTVTIDDPMIKLAANQTNTDDDLVDTGIYMTYDVSDTQNYSGIFRDTSNSNKAWVFVEGITGEPGSTVTYTASDLAYIEAIIDGGTY